MLYYFLWQLANGEAVIGVETSAANLAFVFMASILDCYFASESREVYFQASMHKMSLLF